MVDATDLKSVGTSRAGSIPAERTNLPCAKCGYPKKEHSYNGACYGLCGEWTPNPERTNRQREYMKSRKEICKYLGAKGYKLKLPDMVWISQGKPSFEDKRCIILLYRMGQGYKKQYVLGNSVVDRLIEQI